MIEFSCPKCGRKMRVTETAAGKRGRCKNCDASVVVPVAGESNVGATEQALYQAVLRTASPVLSQGVACDAFPDAGRGSNAVPIASRSDHEFDKHQKIGLWLAGGGLLVVCISPFFKWVNFGAGGVSGLAVDGKIVLAATVIAAIAYWWSVARGRWRVPLFLLVQSWGTLVVIWMAKLIGQTTPSLDAPEVKDNPFAVLMASQVGPGAGLYLGLVGGIAVAGGLGFVAVRCLFPVGRLKLFYAIQSTSCLLGLLLAVLVSPDARSKHTDDSHQSGNKEVAREDAAKDNDDKGNPIADPWETATTVAEDEVVRVEVENVAIEKLRTRSILGKENTSKDDWVIVTLRISNKTDAQKITYRSWGESSFDSHSKLQDDLGNKYSPSYDHDIVGRTTIESVYPGKSVTDLLAFEIPVTKAKFLKLTLPKSKCDAGEGELLLKIPMPRQRISEEKLLPPLEKGGRPDAKAKMNQAAIDVGAEPPDEVLTILVADQGYAVRRITAEVAGYFPAEFDDLIRLARNAKPNDAGVRVRILRSESA